MPARMFTMPKSLDESLASSQPRDSPTDEAGQNDHRKATHSLPEESPIPHDEGKNIGVTFASQDKLPKLPIPLLEDTCRKYKAALKPLQNRHEQEDTAAAVQEFLKTDGPELHARLKKYATGKTSYIEQFCAFVLFSICYRHLTSKVRDEKANPKI